MNTKKLTTHKLAIINLVFVVFVILWGAWVRLSGSGAGCGDHWPLCNGEALPLDAGIKTITELTHRLTSGIFGITIALMAYFSFKEFNKKHPARKWCSLALVFTIIEALIGAVLVKKGLVEDNDSIMRAWVIALHLANTLFLVGTLVYSEYLSRGLSFIQNKLTKKDLLSISAYIALFLMVGATGAVTALGNTLFPDTSLLEGMQKDFSESSHFLIRLRIIHPILAITLVLNLLQFSLNELRFSSHKKAAKSLLIFSIVALAFGVVNWLLMAPSWGALVHLALANVLWMSLIYVIAAKCFQKADVDQ